MTRREALARLPALAAVPWAVSGTRQTPAPRLRQVALGRYHMLLVEPDGTLKAWADGPTGVNNNVGELGQGHLNPLENYRAYTVPGVSNVVKVAAGVGSSFALLADGRILAWGERGTGELGITDLAFVEEYADSRPHAATPTPVAVRFDAVDLSVGAAHVLALARDGSVWAWGDGTNGRLGIGPLPVINFTHHTPAPMSFVPFPVRIPGLSDVVAVSAASNHSLALLKDGTLRAWGANKWGQLGDGTTVDRATPVRVNGIANAVAVSADVVSVAILADGSALSWGSDVSGSLGRPPWSGGGRTPNPVPLPVPGVTDARGVSVGNAILVLTHSGTVIGWGWDAYGELGRGSTSGSTGRPAGLVKGLTGVHWVATRPGRSVAVLTDGRIVNWGPVRPFVSLKGGVESIASSPLLLNVDGLDNSGRAR